MLRFDKEQKVFEFGDMKIGGQPGEYPTVLFGSMFYNRHKIVTDEDKGIFDKNAADTLWTAAEEISDVTGNPHCNQIVAETNEAMKSYIDWFVDGYDEPFLIDSSAGDVRAYGVEYVTEIGVADRAIHNSINASIQEEEVVALTESDVSSAIILAFNATEPGVKGKIEILEIGAAGIEKGMLEIGAECGITKPLVDIAAMPLGSGAGANVRTGVAVKARFGLPVGGGYHNSASAWDWMKKFKKEHREAWPPVDIGNNLIAGIAGADYYLYGPIENSTMVAPAAAMIDIMVAENAEELGLTVKDPNHPFKKLI
ncbi:tetrahydromethanopterin S-methyltransferase subunit H [ANME-2 cluster archaeon]|nr:MAG: tetrahydromethanopterin S-methyltransferase subunit H [ANME-2 cluster archaeon]RLG24499.1 MAG: tetrahydromethanopterin S-methyltransferase subunit H [Methanosarcinales archaeon]